MVLFTSVHEAFPSKASVATQNNTGIGVLGSYRRYNKLVNSEFKSKTFKSRQLSLKVFTTKELHFAFDVVAEIVIRHIRWYGMVDHGEKATVFQ